MNEKRLAQIGIIVSEKQSVAELNAILGSFGEYVVGRMGLPMKDRGVSVISVVIEAPADVINALTGKIGGLSGIQAKTLYAKI